MSPRRSGRLTGPSTTRIETARPSRPRRAAAATSILVDTTDSEEEEEDGDEEESPEAYAEDTQKSHRLTLKMPANKLKEVTGGNATTSRGRPARAAAVPYNSFTQTEIVSGPRSSRSKRQIIDHDSDEDDEEEEEETWENDAEGEEIDDEEEEDDEEEDDAEGDVDMDDYPAPAPPPPAPAARKQAPAASKPSIKVTPSKTEKFKSVEQKEMEMDLDDDDDDEELSELESDLGEEEEEDEDDDGLGEEDAEGEEDEMDAEGEDDDLGAVDGVGSRDSTPDYARMTKRQRGQMGDDFLQLPMGPQVKKHLTAEEHAMRRAEMARRRKNLSEKRNEEEKMDTINKLLKKQAPKRRGKVAANETAGDATPNVEEEETFKPNAVYTRWVSSKDGCRIGVVEEWNGTPVGRVFEGAKGVETN